MSWSPDQYLKFAQPRLRPVLDLLGRVSLPEPECIYDLGCGTGNATRLLVERWPRSAVTGVDDSTEMLGQAQRDLPEVKWVNQSLGQWTPDRPASLIFSNAALHWLPDHATLLPRLASQLAPGGVLAVQMPRNFAAPSHRLIAETARSGAWHAKVEHVLRPSPVADPAVYHRLLASLGRHLDIWETEYLHVLRGEDPVKEWVKGTWLKPVLDQLAGTERDAFEADYAERLRSAYPPQADGTTLFPFRRLFLVLQKS